MRASEWASVLFLNKTQLTASVRGLYGAGIDADSYLGKFIQFTLTLPKLRDVTDQRHRSFNRIFCDKTLALYGFPKDQEVDGFADAFAVTADYFRLSLRDVERGVILYSLGQPRHPGIAAWLIGLKLGKPELFAGILRGDVSAHKKCSRSCRSLQSCVPDPLARQ